MLEKLSPEQFRQLSVLTDAGFDAVKAVTTINAESDTRSLAPVIIDLKKGSALSAALTKAKLITDYEKIILEIAEGSGNISAALNLIATSHLHHDIAKAQMKGYGGMLSFSVAGGLPAIKSFLPKFGGS